MDGCCCGGSGAPNPQSSGNLGGYRTLIFLHRPGVVLDTSQLHSIISHSLAAISLRALLLQLVRPLVSPVRSLKTIYTHRVPVVRHAGVTPRQPCDRKQYKTKPITCSFTSRNHCLVLYKPCLSRGHPYDKDSHQNDLEMSTPFKQGRSSHPQVFAPVSSSILTRRIETRGLNRVRQTGTHSQWWVPFD